MKARNWIALALGTLVAFGASYAAYTLAGYSWNQVVDYRSPYARVMLPETVDPGPPSTVDPTTSGSQPPLLVFVIIDGLRDDVSRRMPTLNTLRARGYDAVVRTSQPSLSFPNWTTLLSGAPQRVSGVTTNWFKGRVPVETLIDVALRASLKTAVSAPTDFESLYGVKRSGHVFLKDWVKDSYMSGEITDNAIRLGDETKPAFLLVHFPDVDEMGHQFGGSSRQYLEMALRVDKDLGRLVSRFDATSTVFVVASDHGHIATGGHGGWERVVTDVPAVFSGAGVTKTGRGTGTQDQVAPTAALLAGLPAPRNATGAPMLGAAIPSVIGRFDVQRLAAFTAYASVVRGGSAAQASKDAETALMTYETSSGRKPREMVVDAPGTFAEASGARLARERSARRPMALLLGAAAMLVLVAIALLSWRALAAALAGTAAYYVVYNALYFIAHGYRWSLSAFNSEDMLKTFFNARMLEAVIAGIVAALIAAEVYRAIRREPQPPKGEYLPGWLALGSATVLAIQATLGMQVAWYLWTWGAEVNWILPDFMWAFKYDLDLIQLTAVGAVAVLAPVVTYLVGRYHPVRTASDTDFGTGA